MGLYDDDKAGVTSGDVLDVIYFQGKFAANKLDAALKSKQPEYPIRLLCVEVINSSNDILKTYPNHGDVKAWKAKAEDIQKKVDANAPSSDWKANFSHWKDYAYEAGWRSYFIAKMATAQEDFAMCKMHASEVVTQFGRALDRMKDWPEDVKAFVTSAKAEAETLLEKAKSKM